MKKLFLAICFSVFPLSVFAGVNEVFDPTIVSNLPQQPEQKNMVIHDITPDELSHFLEERLKNAVIMRKDQITQDNIAFEPSENAKKIKKEQEKSTFEKIYENALAKANSRAENAQIQSSWQETQQKQIEKFKGNLATIDVIMPHIGKPQTIAAVEHIPYLYDKIDILPDGMVLFNEQLFILTEGKNAEHGLIKKLPRYIYNRNGKKKEINYTLAGVTINGTNVEYKISEKNNEVWIEPTTPQNLEAGIYQYNFSFMANRLIDTYDDIKEFYWNLSGKGWDYVIAKMGASISLPTKSKPLMAFALNGYGNNLQQDGVVAKAHNNNILSFTSTVPLFLKESMHISIILQKDDTIVIPWVKKISNFFDDNIEIFISLLSLFFISGAYTLSWISIKKNKAKPIAKLKKTAQILRFLQKGYYDHKNFMVFLLDLYCRNIIDIQQAGETVILVKKTDNIKKLDKSYIKAINAIFGKNDAVFKVNDYNLLKINRAAKYLKYGLQTKILNYILKANGAYLFLSAAMLFIAIGAITYAKALGSITFILLCTITCIAIITACFLCKKYQKLITNIVVKSLAIVLLCVMWILYSAFVSPWAALAILLTCLVIAGFTIKLARRDGLLANILAEVKKQREYLLQNIEIVSQGKSFVNKQAMIFALDLEDEFATDDIVDENNKISAVKQILKILK